VSSPDSGEALVARCAAGDVDALGGLYDRFGAAAYGLARRMTGEDALAEAAVEAAFLDVWRQAGFFDPARGKASTWVLGLVHRRARGAPRRVPGDAAAGDRVVTGDRETAEGEAARAALAQLEPDERRVLELAYLDGYTEAEIAALLGEPRASVGNRLHEALTTLRDLLGAVSR
jgi:RNA polymerase sigma-70 factor (ECF subfamily)